MGTNQTYNLLYSKGNHKQNEKTTYSLGENICKWCDQQGLISEIYKQFIQLNNEKNQTIQLKNGQKTWIDISLKNIHRCMRAKLLQSRPTLWPYELQLTRLLCPWDSPGKNIGVGYCALLWGIFLNQGVNPCRLHLLQWQAGSLPLGHLGNLGWKGTWLRWLRTCLPCRRPRFNPWRIE